MKVPADEAVFDSAWLSRGLFASPNWRHGHLEVVSTARIGVEYGSSGRTHSVVAESERGGRVSFVVKEEKADAVERELLFHRELGEALLGSVPECYGGGSDPELDRGLLSWRMSLPPSRATHSAGTRTRRLRLWYECSRASMPPAGGRGKTPSRARFRVGRCAPSIATNGKTTLPALSSVIRPS
jgi:hypothetical protein